MLAPKACELPLADAECSNIAQMAVSSTEVVYVLFHAFSPALTKCLCAGSAGLAQLLLSREAFKCPDEGSRVPPQPCLGSVQKDYKSCKGGREGTML